MKKVLLSLTIVILHISFSFAQNGPGGVGSRNGTSALKVWLDATELSNVVTVTGPVVKSLLDKSGNNNHVTTTAGTVTWGTTLPTYATNQVNGNAAVQFRGVPLGNETMATAGSTPDVFAVIKVNSYSGSGITICNPDNGFHQGTYRTGPDFSGAPDKYSSNATNGALLATPTATFPLSTYGITNFYYGIDQGSNQSIMSINGSQTPFTVISSNYTATQLNKLWLGRYPAGGHDQDCDISEVLVYNTKRNATQRAIIENYLASKYAIGAIANDYYIGDTPGNGNYDLDVIGTGQMSASDNHVLSNSENGLNIDISLSTVNGSYLFAGHNKATNSISTSNLSGAVLARWDRDFYLDKTNLLNSGNTKLIFDFSKSGLGGSIGSVANYTLIYRSTAGGTFAEVTVASATQVGNTIEFQVSDANLVDGYYTIGTKNLITSPVAAQTNNALNFDGTNDVVNVPYTATIATSPFTVEYWVKPSQVTNVQWVASKDNGNGDMDFIAGISASAKFRFAARNYAFDLNGTTNAVVGTWYHIASVYDGTTAKIFLNGNLEAILTVSGSFVSNAQAIRIGCRQESSANTQFFQGDLDEVRIWNLARSQAQIQASMNSELAGNESGLVAYYNFNQGIAVGNNTGLTTLTGKTNPPFNGTLSGFALTGTSSNWVSGVVYPPSSIVGSAFFPATGNSPYQVAVADFNNDGNQDLATANHLANNFSILTGTGAGSFGNPNTIPSLGTNPISIVAGDYNGDGWADVAILNNSGNVAVFTNTGIGTFGAGVTYSTTGNPNEIVQGDFNRDGRIDLAVSQYIAATVGVFLNNGNGTFATRVDYTGPTNLQGLATGDINMDGVLDLVTASNSSGILSVLTGTGTGTFGAKADYTILNGAIGITIGDFNRDGFNDVAAAINGSNQVSVLSGTGTGTLGTKQDFNTGAGPFGIGNADMNGDGFVDLVVANTSGTISILTNTGIGTFPTKIDIGVSNSPRFITLTDLNKDQKSDVAVGHYNITNASILLNTFANNQAPAFVSISNPLSVCGVNGAITANFTGSFLTYQWYRNGVSIAGANTISLTSGFSGAYFVVASNVVGSATSSVTTITACNNALHFLTNGTSGSGQLGPFVEITNNPNDFNFGTQFSIEAWVRPEVGDNGNMAIFSKGPSNGSLDNSYIFQINTIGGVKTLKFYNANASANPYWFDSGVTIPNNTWTHVAVTYINPILSFFVNGELRTTIGVNFTLNPSGNPQIGRQGGVGGCTCNKFNGQIDEIRIWNVARTPNDIQQNIYRTIQGNLPGLVAAYNFNQGVGGGNNTGVTTLIDQAGGNHNGTLNSFTNLAGGVTSNWVGSITTVTGAYQFAAPFISMPPTLTVCGGVPTTAMATVTGQGSFTYQWLRNGVVLSGQTTNTLTLTSSLTTTTGTFQVLATSIYGTTTSAGLNLTFGCNNALDFDGVDDNIFIGNLSQLEIGANFSGEAWVFPRTKSQINWIFGKQIGGSGPGWAFYLNTFNTSDGRLILQTNGGNIYQTATSIIPLNAWSHVALVISNNTPVLYINGVQTAFTGIYSNASSSLNFRIGASDDPSFFFNGQMDEVRIWNIALSQQDIQNNRFVNFTNTVSGLVGYWDFNQGVAGGNNTGIPSLIDRSSNAFNGIFVNTALNGSSSNFVGSTGSTTTTGVYTFAAPTQVAISPNQTVCSGVTIPLSVTINGSGLGGYQWRFNGNNIAGANASTLTLTGVTSTSAGIYTVVITSLGGNLTSSGISLSVGCNNALNFDGSNDFVTFPLNFANAPSNQITLEAWINPSSLSSPTTFADIIRTNNAGSGGFLFSFQSSGTLLSFGTGLSVGGWQELDIPISSGNYLNQWVHIAATYDGQTKRVYRNGVLLGSFNITGSIIGSNICNLGRDPAPNSYYNGSMDEVRIWNVALSQTDIDANRFKNLSTTTPGLVVYYDFNQGIPSGSNSTLTTLIDRSGNNINGTLTNFTLNTGSTSNWISATGGSSVSGIYAFAAPTQIGISPNQTVCSGLTIPLSVTINGSGLGGYQWRKDGVNIAGATSPTLTLSGITATTAGVYSLLATSLGTNFTSTGISLGVGCNNALNFTASSQFILGTNAGFNFLNNFTFESWVRIPIVSSTKRRIFNRSSGANGFGFGIEANGKLGGTNYNQIDFTQSTGTLVADTWTHVAYVVSNNTVTYYINGLASGSSDTNPLPNLPSANFKIGYSDYNTGESLVGDLDEVRIWNIALAQQDIQNNYLKNLSNTVSGLLAYYDLNVGIPNGNNTALLFIPDKSGNNFTSTLTGFTLTGVTSNFISAATTTITDIYTFAAPTVTGFSPNQTVCSGVTTTMSVTATGSALSYQWYRNTLSNPIAGQTFATLTLNPSFNTTAGTFFVVVSNPSGAETSAGINLSVGCNNALDFDGVDDFVNLGTSTGFNITNDITIEAWIKADAWKTNVYEGNILSNEQIVAANEAGYSLRCGNNGQLNLELGNGSWFSVNSPVASMLTNQWYHVAGVKIGSNLFLYINGSQVASGTMPPTIAVSTSPSHIGGSPSYIGTRNFDGLIDEVRVWNIGLSQAEIQTNLNRTIESSVPGLVAAYNFNQGLANGNNALITTLTDQSGNAINGTLTNFSLTGANSNWTSSTTTIIGNYIYIAPTFPGGALHFDGVDDYLHTGDIMPIHDEFTIEARVNFSNVTGNKFIFGKNTSNGHAYSLQIINSVLVGKVADTDNVVYTALGSNISSGGEYQLMMTYQKGVSLKLYVNGSLNAVTPVGNLPIRSDVGTAIIIGTQPDDAFGPNKFVGIMDEFRYWTRVLSPAEIQSRQSCQISSTTAVGLLINYDFNQGAAEGNNTAITSLINRAGSDYNATLLNGFNLTGTGSNFIQGNSYFSSICGQFLFNDLRVYKNSVLIVDDQIAASTANGTNFGTVDGGTFLEIFELRNEGFIPITITSVNFGSGDFVHTLTGNVIAPSSSVNLFIAKNFSSLPGNYSTSLVIISSDMKSPTYDFVIAANFTAPGEALKFDGENDYVQVPYTSGMPVGNQDFTIEAWLNYPGGQTGHRWFATMGTNTGDQMVLLGIDGDATKIRVHTLSTNDALTNVDANHRHYAFVYKGATKTMDIYVDGGNTPIESITFNTPLNLPSTGNLVLGSFEGNYNTFASNTTIDEVRIWNRALLPSEIAARNSCVMTNTILGIAAHYDFNQYLANGNNAGSTQLVDRSGNGKNGTLNNFLLSTAGSNWVLSNLSPFNLGSCSPVSGGTITVSGNGNLIANNATTTSPLNNTEFGTRTLSQVITKTFRITSGIEPIEIISISSSDPFEVSAAIYPITLGGNSFYDFTVSFSGVDFCQQDKQINIQTNSVVTPEYYFAIGGFIDYDNFIVSGSKTVCGSSNMVVSVSGAQIVDTGGDLYPVQYSLYNQNHLLIAGPLTLGGTGAFTFTTPNVTTTTGFYVIADLAYVGVTCIKTMTGMATMVVNLSPTVNANVSPSTICQGESATFTGSGALTYSWTGGVMNGISSFPSASGVYTVTGTDANGCTGFNAKNITVNPLPNITLKSPDTKDLVCEGQKAVLVTNGVATSTITGGVTSGVEFSISTSTAFTISGTNNLGCSSSITKTVTVLGAPQLIPISKSLSYGTTDSYLLSTQTGLTYSVTSGDLPHGFSIVSNSLTGIASTVIGIANEFTISGSNGACNATTENSISVLQTYLTVAAKDTSLFQFAAFPALSQFRSSITGAVLGDIFIVSHQVSTNNTSTLGTFVITPSVSGSKLSNYNIITNNGTLSIINRLPLTITAPSFTRQYGDLIPISITSTIVGLQLGDQVVATFVTENSTTTGLGTYPVTIGGLSGRDAFKYAIASVTNGVQTLRTRRLTIRIFDLTIAESQLNNLPTTFPGSMVGLIPSEPIPNLVYEIEPIPGFTDKFNITPEVSNINLTQYALVILPGTLSVKAGITITGNSFSKIYGQANPALSGQVVGIKPSDPYVFVSFQTVATPNSPVGEYAVYPVISGSDASKYGYVTILGVLTVTKANLTVAAANQTRLSTLTSPFVFSPVFTGLVNNDNIPVDFTTNAPDLSTTGAYLVYPSVGGSAFINYNITTLTGNLTIATVASPPILITITANNFSRKYGEADGVYTFNTTGTIDANDNVQISVQSNASISSSIGSYSLLPIVSGTDTYKYIFTTVSGVLTIEKNTVTVKALDYIRTYGEQNPPFFNASVSGLLNGDVLNAFAFVNENQFTSAGNYPIFTQILGQVSANYDVVTIAGTLTINKATLTVIGGVFERMYNQPNPFLAFNIIGYKGADQIGMINQLPVGQTTAILSSPVQTALYPVVYSNGDDNNYKFEYQHGTLKINPSTQTITGFNTIARVKTGESVTLSAFATSGLPLDVLPTDSTIISNQGLLVNGLVDGSTFIKLKQVGDANYFAADSVLIAITSTSTGIKTTTLIGIFGSNAMFKGVQSTFQSTIIPDYTYNWSYRPSLFVPESINWVNPLDTNTSKVTIVFPNNINVILPNPDSSRVYMGDIVCKVYDDLGNLMKTNTMSLILNIDSQAAAIAQLAQTLAVLECPPAVTNCTKTFISTFNYGKRVNVTDKECNGGFSDFTASGKIDTLVMGNPYNFKIGATVSTGTASLIFFAIWIDYDNNGSFNDPDDFLRASSEATNLFEIDNLTIRNNDKYEGPRRIRISMKTSRISPNESCLAEGVVGETEDYMIYIKKPQALEAASLVTPNGDEKNDYFIIKGMNAKNMKKLLILDRWGVQIAKYDNYENNWDGKNENGIKVPDGTYYYYFDNGTDENNNQLFIKGFVELKTK